jgi:S1-C subfamily serine protease
VSFRHAKPRGLPAALAAALVSVTTALAVDCPAAAQSAQVCGWIGVQVRQMTQPVADSLGMPEHYGAIFDRPEVGSPAAGAGIQEGDVITTINGSSLMNWRDFAPAIAAIAPDTPIYLDTWRDALAIQVNLTVGSGKCPQ